MSDPKEPARDNQQETDEQKNQEQHYDLTQELRELGNQLEQAIRSTLYSAPARVLQHDISLGLHQIVSQLQSTLKTIQEKPEIRNLAERGQQAIDQVQEHYVVKEFQDTLGKGVAQLNEQLKNFIHRIQNSFPPPPPPKPPSQNPPVEIIPIVEEELSEEDKKSD